MLADILSFLLSSTSLKPTYDHLIVELLQSDKNQIFLSNETVVNVATVTSLHTDPTPIYILSRIQQI